VAARTQSSKKYFQTGTGTNSAFYMYERRYATEPFTAVEPSAPVDWTSGRAVRNVQRRRGFGLVVDNVQDRETAVAASRRGVREHAEDHSIRKDLGLASGRERPPREGRGADFRAAEGGRSRPGCTRGSLVGRATRTAQSAVRPRMATAPTVSRESDLRLRAAARE
jgi:hypothetical protein